MATPDLNDIRTWQYELPEQLIAARPAERRDDSRLMVVRRESGTVEHHQFRDLPDLLTAGDRLIFNNTKVLPARLFGFRTSTLGKWEGLFLGETPDGLWRITGQTRGRLQPGERLTLVPAETWSKFSGATAANDAPRSNLPDLPAFAGTGAILELTLETKCEDGSWLVRPNVTATAVQLLQQFGTLPLPPYIGRQVADESDQDRYQTIFANEPGAIAAPTAGLHFTPEVLKACESSGIATSQVTLHVGIGTFRPVNVERLSDHLMHSEWCRLPTSTVADINETQSASGRIVAVGTTSVRTLEAAAAAHMPLRTWEGSTTLFIRPGFRFQVVDQLLTNFHLPGSTLIVLVAALAGYELTMEAYRQAVAHRYRFYSYGDAMLIL